MSRDLRLQQRDLQSWSNLQSWLGDSIEGTEEAAKNGRLELVYACLNIYHG